jgi:molecular chaperone DnaJ
MWVDAVLGAEIEVPTLEGRVPAMGTQPDTVLRLRGKGLPQFGGGGGGRGDLYVSIHIHVPERLSDRQRRLFEQLRETADRKPSSA